MPCRYNKTGSPDMSSHIRRRPLSDNLRQKGCYAPPKAVSYKRADLSPNFRKGRCRPCRILRQPVNLRIPIRIIVRNRMDKAVKPVSYPAVSHNDNADTAHTGTALVGCLKIYCCKIFHLNHFILSPSHSCHLCQFRRFLWAASLQPFPYVLSSNNSSDVIKVFFNPGQK